MRSLNQTNQDNQRNSVSRQLFMNNEEDLGNDVQSENPLLDDPFTFMSGSEFPQTERNSSELQNIQGNSNLNSLSRNQTLSNNLPSLKLGQKEFSFNPLLSQQTGFQKSRKSTFGGGFNEQDVILENDEDMLESQIHPKSSQNSKNQHLSQIGSRTTQQQQEQNQIFYRPNERVRFREQLSYIQNNRIMDVEERESFNPPGNLEQHQEQDKDQRSTLNNGRQSNFSRFNNILEDPPSNNTAFTAHFGAVPNRSKSILNPSSYNQTMFADREQAQSRFGMETKQQKQVIFNEPKQESLSNSFTLNFNLKRTKLERAIKNTQAYCKYVIVGIQPYQHLQFISKYLIDYQFISNFNKCEFLFYSDSCNWLGIVLQKNDYRLIETLMQLDELLFMIEEEVQRSKKAVQQFQGTLNRSQLAQSKFSFHIMDKQDIDKAFGLGLISENNKSKDQSKTRNRQSISSAHSGFEKASNFISRALSSIGLSEVKNKQNDRFKKDDDLDRIEMEDLNEGHQEQDVQLGDDYQENYEGFIAAKLDTWNTYDKLTSFVRSFIPIF
eukprot:403331121